MWRTALKGIVARKGRILLTAIAVIAGTSFLSGTLIFSDTIRRTFDNLFAEVFKDTDGYVRSVNVIEGDFGTESRERTPIELAATISAVPGVVDVEPLVQELATVIKADGEKLETNGPPTFGGNLIIGKLSPWRLTDGSEEPNGPDEVVFDDDTAAAAGYEIGDTVRVSGRTGTRDFTLVGVVRYGGTSSPGGASFALFDLDTAAEFVAEPGKANAILVAGDGSVSDEELTARIDAATGGQFEALTGAEITKETQSDIAVGLGFITMFLTIFSLIALGVGVFVIYNVFSVTAAQRQRENALFRAVGASKRQVTMAMLVEALAVGLVGALLGLLAGVGLSKGLQGLFNAIGVEIPSKGLVLSTRTVVVTFIAGVLATLTAGILPALRAGRVPPLAAMRDTAIETTGSSKGRLLTAGVLAGLGVAQIVAVVSGASASWLGLAVLFIFIAVLLLGPLMAAPMAKVLGRPIAAARGMTGAMATQNVARNPKRTARTAAPVLIGVALVTGASVFAASIKAQIRDVVGEQFTGDYVIQAGGGGPQVLGLDADFVSRLDGPAVQTATGIGFLQSPIGPKLKNEFITVVDPATAGALLDVEFESGSFDDLTDSGVLINQKTSDNLDLEIGSVVPITNLNGTTTDLTVQGVYVKDEILGKYTVTEAPVINNPAYFGTSFVFVDAADGVDDDEFRAQVEPVVDDSGIAELQSRDEFIDDAMGSINQILGLIYGLLGLSIIIAVFGIVLTLLLSVYERRRETGLLRAVGMTKRQVRQTVRWESIITSVYGAIVGVVLGLVLGYVIVLSLRSQGFNTFSVPVASIVVILLIAIVVGVLAAVIPARRAVKADILDAIATT